MYKWARNAAISAAIAVLAACGGGGTDLAVNEPPPSESPPAEPPLAASALDPGAKFAPAQLYAIGVVTPNANDTLLEYQRVLGVLSCLNTPSGTVSDPAGRSVAYRMLVPCFSNFYVKLQQPLNGLGPYNAYLQEHGLGVMNLQIHTADAQAVRATLEQQGATWVLSTAADPWAYVDTEDKLGWILEPINFLLRFPPKLDPNNTLPLGARPVTRVGIAVDKLETAVTVYSKFFNIPAPAITELQGIAVSGSQTRSLRVAGWTQGAGIELVESPAAGTPWSEHVRVHGWQALSLGFDVGDRLEDYQRDLLSKGGKLIFKTADGSRVYLDFRDTLGLVIELDGTPAAN